MCIDLHDEESGERKELLSILGENEDMGGNCPTCPDAHVLLVKLMEGACFGSNLEDREDSFSDRAEVRFSQVASEDRESVIACKPVVLLNLVRI